MRPVELQGPGARGRCVGNAGINGNLRFGTLPGREKAAENVGAFPRRSKAGAPCLDFRIEVASWSQIKTKGNAMILEIALTAAAFHFLRRRRKKPGISWRWMRSPISRSDALGAAGEALAHAKLRETLEWLCGSDFYLHEGPLVVEHAPGSEFPTAEIDHLAVTPFGIFIFETKHWSGRIFPSSARGMLTRVAGTGVAEDRRSPLDQNRAKVEFFRACLPSNWPVAGAGIFTSAEAQLDPSLNANLLSLADIRQWMRMRRDAFAGMPSVDVARAVEAVALYSDSSPAAIEAHKRRIRM